MTAQIIDGKGYAEGLRGRIGQHVARLKTELTAAVAESREPVTLVMQFHREARVDALLRLTTLARQVGITAVHAAVRPPVLPQPADPIPSVPGPEPTP